MVKGEASVEEASRERSKSKTEVWKEKEKKHKHFPASLALLQIKSTIAKDLTSTVLTW
jgi:hypothetical protein